MVPGWGGGNAVAVHATGIAGKQGRGKCESSCQRGLWVLGGSMEMSSRQWWHLG